MHHQTQYTLDAVDHVEGVDIATVSARATLELEPDMSKFPENAPQPQIDLTEADFSSQIMFDLSRHEAVGRDTVENRTVTMTMDVGDLSIVTTMKEKIHSQVLRIEEY